MNQLSNPFLIFTDDLTNPMKGIVSYSCGIKEFEYFNVRSSEDRSFAFDISEKDYILFRELFILSIENRRFDLEIENGIKIIGCFIKSIRDYNYSLFSEITIFYNLIDYAGESTFSREIVPIFNGCQVICNYDPEERILEEIIEELDIWLTSPEKYFDMKIKGLIKYV
jgi:hypothetical protein